jgi:methionyl-tRNA formyltransferase
VFFGSGEFAIPLLDAVRSLAMVSLVGVVSGPDRPVGRKAIATPTPLAARADAAGIRLLKPERLRSRDAAEAIADLRPDLGVSADYGRIVPPAIIGIPPHGILNVHPSLLPRHRGATPVPATILAGDAEAGVTIIRMDEGTDTGPIVAVERWPLRGDEDAPGLEAEAARRGAELLSRTVPAWLSGAIREVPQPGSAATVTRPFRREDGRLDPGLSTAELERTVRALRPWPGTYLDTPIGRLVVLEASTGPADREAVAGTLVADGDGLGLATADGLLRLLVVQPAGGRPMTGAEFRRGRGRSLVRESGE